MMTDKTGGSAFPGENDHQSGNNTWHSSGMTLRQYYAAKAMQAYALEVAPEQIAKIAFDYADAMINFEEQGK